MMRIKKMLSGENDLTKSEYNFSKGVIGDVVDKMYKPVYEQARVKRWSDGKKKKEINGRDHKRGLICREARDWMLRGRCIM